MIAEVLSLVVFGGAWLVFLVTFAAAGRPEQRRRHPERCGCDTCRACLALDIARLERELDINQPEPEPPVAFDASKITAGMIRADKITVGHTAENEPKPLGRGPLRILYGYGSDGSETRTEIRAWGS